jgi:hypothetical protein
MEKQSVKLIMVMVFILMMFTACGAPTNSGMDVSDVPGNERTMNEINVPQDFNWKTFREVNLTLNGGQGAFEIQTMNGNTIYRANLIENKTNSFKIAVAAYEKEIVLKHAGETRKIVLTNTNAQLNFNL